MSMKQNSKHKISRHSAQDGVQVTTQDKINMTLEFYFGFDIQPFIQSELTANKTQPS